MAELRKDETIESRALEMLILTATRTSELLGAQWPEIDLASTTWTIPPERTKARKEHRVPLCARALQILNSLAKQTEPFPILPKTMRKVLQRLRPGHTAHGMRSSFRDWCAERTRYPEHVVEAVLAHAIPDAVIRAYKRTTLFEQRYSMFG